jgi:hypothetical protein
MQPSLAEQLRRVEEDPHGKIVEISLSERFPQLPADATMHDRLMRDEEILKYINGDPE